MGAKVETRRIERTEEQKFADSLRGPVARFVHRAAEKITPKKLDIAVFGKDAVSVPGLDAGAGHKSLASHIVGALKKSLLGERHKATTGEEIKVGEDMNPHMHWLLGKVFFGKGYEFTVEKMPLVYDAIYNVLPKIGNAVTRRNGIRKLMTPALEEFLIRDHAKTIVCTHPVQAEMYNILQTDGKLPVDVKIVNVVTDFSVNEGFNCLGLTIVPHQAVKDKLVSYGKDASMIVVLPGLPAGQKYLHERTKEIQTAQRAAANKRLSTPERPDILGGTDPMFLFSGGGKGLMLDGLRKFASKWDPAQKVKAVVVCGDNPGLFKKMQELVAKTHPNLELIPLPKQTPEQMFELEQAATVLVGKPGGGTLGQAHGQARAFVATSVIPGQEWFNRELGAKEGWMVHLKLEDLNGPDGIKNIISRYEAACKRVAEVFPDPANLPDKYAQTIADYESGKIPDSPREIAERERLQVETFFRPTRTTLGARLAGSIGRTATSVPEIEPGPFHMPVRPKLLSPPTTQQ